MKNEAKFIAIIVLLVLGSLSYYIFGTYFSNDQNRSNINLELKQFMLNMGYRLEVIQKQYETEGKTINDLPKKFDELVHTLNGKIDNVQGHQHSEHMVIPEMTSVLKARDEKKDLIFFTETSGTGTIRARFVCAIESAANTYPDADIYLLIAYTPPKIFKYAENEALFNVVAQKKNIQVLQVDLEILTKGSIIENFIKSKTLYTSKFLPSQTSDVLRIFCVCKYGGKFFDLDVITVNQVPYKQFLITEMDNDNCFVAAGFFGFEKNFEECDNMLNYINSSYNGQEWYAVGPAAFTQAMYRHTGQVRVGDFKPENLKGFVKLNYYSLFPIEWFELNLYFNETASDFAMQRIANISNSIGLVGMHVGNNAVKFDTVKIGSRQAYGLLAQKYCPVAYNSCDTVF